MGQIRQDNRGTKTILTFRVGIGKGTIPMLTTVVEKSNPEALLAAVDAGLAQLRPKAAL